MTVPRVTADDLAGLRRTALIRQEHDYGCGIATLAMVTNATYDEVRTWLLDNWPGGNERHDDWLEKRGIHKGIADFYLAAHGYVWRTLYGGWQLPTWPPEPFAPVHMACVRQPSNNAHYVAMRADGVVLDPLTGEERRLTDWPEVQNVQGIWSERDLAAARDQIAAVRALHEPVHLADFLGGEWRCIECRCEAPCNTTAALAEGPEPEPTT